MNIFLTGGTGFIGSHVALELLGRGHRVTILARNPAKVPALAKIPNVEIVPGGITDRQLLEKLVQGKDAVVHVALNYTKKSGWEVLLDDTLPSVYLSDAAAGAGVRHFIYTSSTAANDSLYTGGGDSPEEKIKLCTTATKQRPATFYGATKAASENFLVAQSYLSPMRINIIRPGYTFGNPALPGGSTQADTRFRDIARAAVANEPVTLTKNDGTQFIFAGDLARLYTAVLESDVNRKTYYGLGGQFIAWSAIAQEAVRRCGSRSAVILEDKGWSADPLKWDVSDMKRDFGLEFDAWRKILEHLDYYIALERGSPVPPGGRKPAEAR
ncbi:MAG: NAD(P)-dependent oxidoreductase [Anaerolineales bacterium]